LKRPSGNPAKTVDDLLEEASASMAALNVEKAYQSYSQAASLLQLGKVSSRNPSETELINVLEKMGELQVSMGDQDRAKEHFVQALGLLEEHKQKEQQKQQHNQSDGKKAQEWEFYESHCNLSLYIGQLSLEQEALEAYLRGVTSLEKCIRLVEELKNTSAREGDETMKDNESTSETFLHDLKLKLSGAYCNLAELFLTDLCEEESAENDCEQYLEKAFALKDADGEPLVDALQTMASLRLSQQERQLEAVPFILRAYEKHRVGSEALAALVGLQGKQQPSNTAVKEDAMEEDDGEEERAKELVEVEAANNLPEFEFRCQTAKLLLECAGLLKKKRHQSGDALVTTQEEDCISAAISVLGSLLAQNDEVVEIWYLTGCAFAAKTPPLVETALFYLNRSEEMLTDIRNALQQEAQFVGDEEERKELMEQVEMNSAQMQDVQSKIAELAAAHGDDDSMPED